MKKDSAADTTKQKTEQAASVPQLRKTSYESRGRRRAQRRRRLLLLGIFLVLFSAVTAVTLYRPSVWDRPRHLAAAACTQALERLKQIEWERLWKESPLSDTKAAPDESASTEALSPKEAAGTGMPAQNSASLEEFKQAALASGTPADIVALLDKNIETWEFVQNYNEKKDCAPSEEPLTLDDGTLVPCLVQWDQRWGYQSYGPGCMAQNGCGPTCMSMVIAGLTKDTTATPYRLAVYAKEHGLVDRRGATSWSLMTKAAKDWGLKVTSAPPNEDLIKRELDAGHPIICRMGPGDFTSGGHFIVLTSYLDGYITLNDSFSIENSSRFWLYTDIADQISQIWIYSVK